MAAGNSKGFPVRPARVARRGLPTHSDTQHVLCHRSYLWFLCCSLRSRCELHPDSPDTASSKSNGITSNPPTGTATSTHSYTCTKCMQIRFYLVALTGHFFVGRALAHARMQGSHAGRRSFVRGTHQNKQVSTRHALSGENCP